MLRAQLRQPDDLLEFFDFCPSLCSEPASRSGKPVNRSLRTAWHFLCAVVEKAWISATRRLRSKKVRRTPIVDGEDRVIGIASQANLALQEKAGEVSITV